MLLKAPEAVLKDGGQGPDRRLLVIKARHRKSSK